LEDQGNKNGDINQGILAMKNFTKAISSTLLTLKLVVLMVFPWKILQSFDLIPCKDDSEGSSDN